MINQKPTDASATAALDPGAVCEGQGRPRLLCPPKSDVSLFCYREGVVDLGAEISDGLSILVRARRSCTARRLPVRR
jgi:hypothetical protein